ncbi:MAG: hypothetical protein LAT79_18355, partial [Kiritimatiellae bacterium]|nr:hypothetical protein [Kiritimatiellia bacterium]
NHLLAFETTFNPMSTVIHAGYELRTGTGIRAHNSAVELTDDDRFANWVQIGGSSVQAVGYGVIGALSYRGFAFQPTHSLRGPEGQSSFVMTRGVPAQSTTGLSGPEILTRMKHGVITRDIGIASLVAQQPQLLLPSPRPGTFNPHLPGGPMFSFETGHEGLFLLAGRAHGKNPAGSFLSTTPIPNRAYVRGPLATISDWNSATHVSDAFIPPRVRLQMSIANPHPSLHDSGFGIQLQILNQADKARVLYTNTRRLP